MVGLLVGTIATGIVVGLAGLWILELIVGWIAG